MIVVHHATGTAYIGMAADLPCPNDPLGRTYRQVNADTKHAIAIGTLVEVTVDDKEIGETLNGIRLFVVAHTRDCDETPLYALGYWRTYPSTEPVIVCGGWSEDSLRDVGKTE